MAAERHSTAFRRTRRYRQAAKELGSKIRSVRQEKGWTLEMAAAKTGLDFRHLQRIEAGGMNPTFATLLRIIDAFQVSALRIFPWPKGVTKLSLGAIRAGPSTGPPDGRRGRTLYLPNPIPEPANVGELRQQVGRAIAGFRRAGEMTQKEFAKKLGSSVQYVQAVEGGKQNLSIGSLAKFANALGVEPGHLLTVDI